MRAIIVMRMVNGNGRRARVGAFIQDTGEPQDQLVPHGT